MTTYRTTREVEARQWDGTLDGINALCRWVNDADPDATADEPLLSYVSDSTGGVWDVFLETEVGALSISAGCWIVRQGEGDYTARTDEQFEASYEVVEKEPERAFKILKLSLGGYQTAVMMPVNSVDEKNGLMVTFTGFRSDAPFTPTTMNVALGDQAQEDLILALKANTGQPNGLYVKALAERVGKMEFSEIDR